MIVLDTHAWIWLVAEPAKLSRRALRVISSAESLGVSAISAWEVATLVRKGRLEFDRPVFEWIAEALAEPRIVQLAVTAEIAAAAGSFGDDFHGDPADRLIAATALQQGGVLITKDESLRALALLDAIW